MKLALVFGNAVNNRVSPEIKKQKDDLVLDSFNSINEMINNSINRSYIFDRILVLSKVTRADGNPQEEINTLANYWNSYAKTTSIIFVCKKGDDDDVANIFESVFQSPLCTTMMVSQVSVNVLMESVNLDTMSITEKYSNKGVVNYEVEVESKKVEAPKKPTAEELKQQKQKEREERHRKRQEEREAKAKNKGEKKSGLFGLFGKDKKSENVEPQMDNSNVVSNPAESEINNDNMPAGMNQQNINQNENVELQDFDWEQQYDNEYADNNTEDTEYENTDFSENNSLNNNFNYQNNNENEQTINSDSMSSIENLEDVDWDSNIDDENDSKDNFNTNLESFDTQDENTSDEGEDSGFTFNIQFEEDDEEESIEPGQITDDTFTSVPENQPIIETPVVESIDNQQSEIFESSITPEQNQDSVFSTNITPEQNQVETNNIETSVEGMADPFDEDDSEVDNMSPYEEPINNVVQEPVITSQEPVIPMDSSQDGLTKPEDIDSVEDTDFDFDFTPVRDSFEPTQPQSEMKVSDVEDEGDFGNLGKLEQSLREAENKPKVIEKVVTKEVVKEVIKIQSNIIDGILKGTTSKMLLVTGDRGSGVTTTAFDIAKAVAQYTNVLYVDGDTELHGLLSYIDYNEFTKYEPAVMQGMKIAKRVDAFWRCRASFIDNIDILSSNYDVDVTDDELMETLSVISEVASNYSLVVIDAPIDRLECFQDMILQCNTVLCCEASKRGMMNLICKLENCKLPVRYKRAIAGKGTMVMTKLYKGLDMKKLLSYIMNMVVLDEVKWLDMHIIPRKPEIDKEFLSDILEG